MVSIIVPIYNSEKNLNRCIKSILSQTYKNIEVLLIDDGSNDDSSIICNKFLQLDARVKYYYKGNGGASSARNLGIKKSRGKLIQFVDSDDYISPYMTEKLVEEQECYDLDWVISGLVCISRYRENIISYNHQSNISIDDFLKSIIKFYNQSILHSCCNKLYRKQLISDLMNTSYRWGEDYIFNICYLKNIKRLSVLSQCFYYYDCTNSSVTRSKYISQSDYIRERFYFSYSILHDLFDSPELDSALASKFIYEQLQDLSNSKGLCQLRINEIKELLLKDKKVIELIIPNNKFEYNLVSNNYFEIGIRILYAKLISTVKNTLKSVLAIFHT